LDISEAIFSNPSVVCVLWSPRLVYFTQRPELSPLEAQLDEILDVPISPFDTRRPANADPSASNPALQRSLSAHRARAASDLREPVRIARPQTGGSIDSEDTIEGGNGTHRRNTSMPWTAANNMPDIHSLDTSVQPTDPTEKTPVSAMSYKSSFHLLGLARTRQRRLTASNSRQSINPVQGPHRVGSEHDLIDLQRQTSYPVDQALSNSQITRMMPTGPDPKVIMRDSRSTQAMLLQKRKEMLGAAIMHEQAALAMLSREFEQASSKFNERFRKEMVRRAEHIYELGARRKLINRCLRVLGVSADKTETETEADFDRDTQEVEKVLATLYRHRCLIYSGYLIWTTQVRDKLMRFLYIQDCLTAIEYYMSESAANVVRKATTLKSSAETDASTVRSRSYSQTVDHRHQPADSDEASELAPLPQRQKQRKSGETRSRNRSASQTSAGSTTSRRTLRIPKLLRRLRSHEKLSASEPKPSARPRKEGPAKARKRTSKFDKGLSRVWEDFIRYKPYYSIMVEFLNSQVSLRVDESSTTSAIAVAERVQLHRILLCNEGEVTDTPNEPPSDESVVKARSLVELENVQVFTANRSDFENQAAYFVDCTYGSRLDEDASKPTTLWPAWIPIELLLSQGKHQVRGIFDELEETQGVEHSDSDSDRGDAAATGKYGKAWWIEDLSKYKRLMNRNNGLVVYDKANPLRIQSDTADSLRPTSSAESTEPSVGVDAGSATNVAANIAANTASNATAAASGGHPGEASDDENDVNNEPDDTDDPIDDTEAASSEQGLSHRANHFSVFLPELNLACTAEQYIAVYETVTDLLVFIDPEKAAYMDHLNTIQLGMDMSDLRGLLSIIRATQTALRERMPVIYDWYSIQRSRAVLCGSLGLARSRETAGRQRAQASSLLTLDRHRRALELQLRTAMDLFGAAQKQMRRDTAIKGKLVPVQRHASGVSSLGASERSDVPLSECSSQSSSLRSTEETHNTIARTIHLFINKATWHMLENDEQPLCDVTLRWASLKAVTTSDQATHLLSEVHLLYIVNRLPDPMFTDLIGPYIRPKHPKPDFCVEKMIRVQWSELAPVGGISIVERFEVDLFPLRLQLSHDIAQKLINYLYPPQESSAQQPELDPKLESASVQGSDLLSPRRHRRPTMSTIASDDGDSLAAASPPPSSLSLSAQPVPPLSAGDGHGSLDIGSGRSLLHQKIRRPIDEQLRSRAASEAPVSADERSGAQLPRVASGLLATISGRTTPLSLMESNSMINIPQSGDNRDQVDEMKKRASSNKTFLHIKIGGSTLCISYQGRRANNITDLRDFEFHAPMLELRNQVESYFELLMQVKKEYMSVAVQHTGALVKEKFRQLHNRKTWSKTSFGPDWEARRLLIDMDRTIDQEVVASMRNSSNSLVMTTSTEVPGAGPVTQLVENSDLETEESEQLVSRESSVAAAASKGKAPLSKYMILDPRKLMGRRLPNILPRPLHEVGQSEPPPSPRLRGQPTNITQDDGRAVSCDPEMHVNASS
ncbi:Protein SABRE, partial [Coemansia sp. RSA 2704]